MLKLLAILLGSLIIILRGSGVLFPDKIRNFAKNLVSRQSYIRLLGIYLVVLSVSIFIALGDDWAEERVIMGILGTLCLIGGCLITLLPVQYRKIISWFLALPDSAIRIVSGVGFVFGMLILILGIACY